MGHVLHDLVDVAEGLDDPDGGVEDDVGLALVQPQSSSPVSPTGNSSRRSW